MILKHLFGTRRASPYPPAIRVDSKRATGRFHRLVPATGGPDALVPVPVPAGAAVVITPGRLWMATAAPTAVPVAAAATVTAADTP